MDLLEIEDAVRVSYCRKEGFLQVMEIFVIINMQLLSELEIEWIEDWDKRIESELLNTHC